MFALFARCGKELVRQLRAVNLSLGYHSATVLSKFLRAMQLPALSSRAEEFHLRALPEPGMNLSIHTAPDVRPLP